MERTVNLSGITVTTTTLVKCSKKLLDLEQRLIIQFLTRVKKYLNA